MDVGRVKEDVLHSKHAELKDRLRRINQGYDRLRQVSHRGYGSEAGECGLGRSPPGRRPVGPPTWGPCSLWGAPTVAHWGLGAAPRPLRSPA